MTVVLVAAASTALPTTAGATANPTSSRLAGDDRFETAAEIATDTFPEGAANAVIAYGYNFPDALAASYLAGYVDGPILLSDTGDVPDATMDALEALDVDTCYVVGGTAVIGAAAADELEDECEVARIAGENRYETAAEIATTPPSTNVGELGERGRTAIVATGERFADALAMGPIAFAERFPVLLTRPESLHPDAADALDDLGIDHVLIPGGTAAVSAAAQDDIEDMGITTQRLAGDDRFETAVEVATFSADELGDDLDHVNVASGVDAAFPDALALAPHGASESPTLLCQQQSTCGDATLGFVEAHAATIASFHIAGGPARISDDAEEELVEAATTEGIPAMTRAEAVDATTVVVTMSEAVEASGGEIDASQFAYDEDGDGSAAPVEATSGEVSEDGTTITLTFPSGTVATDAAEDTLTYDDDNNNAVDDGDVVDADDGNPLPDQTVTVASPPAPPGGPALANAVAIDEQRVLVTLTEPATAEGGSLDPAQFIYRSSGRDAPTPDPAIAAVLSGDGRNVALTFPADTVTQPDENPFDNVSYTDDEDGLDDGDLVGEQGDEGENSATTVDTAARPAISSATPLSTSQLEVVFAEPVRGYGGELDASQFVYDIDGTDGLGDPVVAQAAALNPDGSLTLTFPGDPIDNEADFDVLSYADDDDADPDDGDVASEEDSSPLVDSFVTVMNAASDATPPTVTRAVAVGPSTLIVVFSERVIVAGPGNDGIPEVPDDDRSAEDLAAPQFRYDPDGGGGLTAEDATGIEIHGDTVLVTFPSGTIQPAAAGDRFQYLDDSSALDDGSDEPDVPEVQPDAKMRDITDIHGTQVASTTAIAVDDGPAGGPAIIDAHPVGSNVELIVDEAVPVTTPMAWAYHPDGTDSAATAQGTVEGAGPVLTVTVAGVAFGDPDDVIAYDGDGDGDIDVDASTPVDGGVIDGVDLDFTDADFLDAERMQIRVRLNRAVVAFGDPTGGELDPDQWKYGGPYSDDGVPQDRGVVSAEAAEVDPASDVHVILTFDEPLPPGGYIEYEESTGERPKPDGGDVVGELDGEQLSTTPSRSEKVD